ncbi:MAG: 50S ribosomal protein L29 [Patescibacteria group bacterium]
MAELKQKQDEDLEKMLVENRRKLFDLRINLNEGKVKNTSDIGKSKKDIARILTVLKSKSVSSREK